MRYIDPAALNLEQAQVVALKVVRDAIETGVDDIGGKVQLGAVRADCVELVMETDMRALQDTVDLWEARCAELLFGSAESPAVSETPNRGVRPPR
ncbi:MAG TPA: hypothetical protein VMU32_08145 [Solirubrobacteraceae bacterium]|nr:hypothetical protein [Solirubrobacteraceae bacterium]